MFKDKRRIRSSHDEFKAPGGKKGAAAVWSLRTKRLYAFGISKRKNSTDIPSVLILQSRSGESWSLSDTDKR